MPNYKGFVTYSKPLICVDCGKEVPRTGGKQTRCPECQKPHRRLTVRQSMHRHYATRYAAKSQEHARNKRRIRKQDLLDVLGHRCAICGYDKFECSLDFHHLDPTKKEYTGDWVNWGFKDIDNLVVLCRNCHQALHQGLVVLPTETITSAA